MDCFKIKLVLRANHHCGPQELTLDVFDHLSLCRSCWAYANYLWHREALEVARKHKLDDEDFDVRLETAWSRRHDKGLHLPPLGMLPSTGQRAYPDSRKYSS